METLAETLFWLRHTGGREPAGRNLAGGTGTPLTYAHVLVVRAVAASSADAHGEVTVGTIASRLGVAPSRASHLVSETTEAGLVERTPSTSDARRVQLALTKAGRHLANSIRERQREVVANLTASWNDADLNSLAELLTRYTGAMTQTSAERSEQRS